MPSFSRATVRSRLQAWTGVPVPALIMIMVMSALVVTGGGLANTQAAPPAALPGGLAPTDIVLLDFSAPWCGPCRSMAPLIDEIASAGWVVRRVDVDREGDLVRRFAVTGVPCYVLLVKGQEIDRINGATTRGELEKLLAKSRAAAVTPAGQALISPPAPVARLPLSAEAAAIPGIPLPISQAASPLALESSGRLPPPVPAQLVSGPASPPTRDLAPGRPVRTPLPQAALPQQRSLDPTKRAALEGRLMAATARLRVADTSGVSWGTGTVIDCRQGEALILTCGHIFRDSQGKGSVEIDLFAPGAGRGLAGQVIAWDLKRDLALVSVFTDAPVEPARVGGVERFTSAGEPVVTVGCNGGQDPTIYHSSVTAVDKYLGPPNVQVAGQPVQGRSGGGLFATDGTLIGVCNAADPTDNEGLFAALSAIHEQLDEVGLAFVYRSAYPSGAVADAVAAAVPAMPAEMPAVSFDRRDRAGAVPTASTELAGDGTLSAGELALIDQVKQHGGKAEVICIVRPHGAPQDSSEVYVLQGSTRGFVDQLSQAHSGRPAAPVTRPLPVAGSAIAPAGTRADVASQPTALPLR